MTTPDNTGAPGTPTWTATGGAASQTGQGDSTQDSAKDNAKEKAAQAADQAKQAADTAGNEGKHVAGVAREEAKNVVGESQQQARALLDEAMKQVDEQSRTQRDRVVGTLRTIGDDIEKMANGEQASGGMAQDIARQVAERARDLSSRLDGREPAELLDEVRSFARRRPGTFLLGALAAGVLAGHVTRGAKEAGQDGSGTSTAGLYDSPYDDVRGTATGSPTAGVGAPDMPPAYPAGSAVEEPGTTLEGSTHASGGLTGPDPVSPVPGTPEPGSSAPGSPAPGSARPDAGRGTV